MLNLLLLKLHLLLPLMLPNNLPPLPLIGFLSHLVSNLNNASQIHKQINCQYNHRKQYFNLVHAELLKHCIIDALEDENRQAESAHLDNVPAVDLHWEVDF